MKRTLLAAIAVALLGAGCAVLSNTIQGSGKSVTENRSVGGFTRVELDGSGDLKVEQNGTESLTITADDNLLQYLTSEVIGGRLKLGTKSGTSIGSSTPVVYKLTVKNLDEIMLAGSGSVDGRGLSSDSMKIDLSGSGDITTAGSAGRIEVVIEGSGNFHGEDFKSKDARIEIDGSGNVTVGASDKLDVTINGSGSVEYIGDPRVTTTSHGSGTVIKKR
jgi:putative autotransporter adhesin-like protein